MRKFIFFIGSLMAFREVIAQTSFQQKPSIDSSVYDKWPFTEHVKLSNDGRCVLYEVYKYLNRSLIIQATDSSWKHEILEAFDASFSRDSRLAIFMSPMNRLDMFELATEESESIDRVVSYKLSKDAESEWLAYLTTDNDLILRNLRTGDSMQFYRVKDYVFSNNGKILLVKREGDLNNRFVTMLDWVNFSKRTKTTIWQGEDASNFAFDSAAAQLAFIENIDNRINQDSQRKLWYYKDGTEHATIRVSNNSPGVEPGLFVNNSEPKFSKDGSRLFFDLQAPRVDDTARKGVRVDIWNYKDDRLQEQQLQELAIEPFKAVILTRREEVIRLTGENERIESYMDGNADFVLVRRYAGDLSEKWRIQSLPSFYLVSTINGNRRIVKENIPVFNIQVSPTAKFIVYWDSFQENYFSYELSTGITRNISGAIPVKLYNKDGYAGHKGQFGTAGWLKDESAILIYDQYDIWQLDLKGQRIPENILKGFGRRNNIIFRYCSPEPIFTRSDEMQSLVALDLKAKKNGFYTHFNFGSEPERLIMGACIYWYHPSFPAFDIASISTAPMIQSTNKKLSIVQKMSATEYPNLYSTKDFKTFTQLTNLQPQRDYNWLTTEFVRWKAFNGKIGEGILYKPENFDFSKKYPIIFYYYEKNASTLNCFHKPLPSSGQINIPSFVSRGYLVFVPDIHYTIGEPGRSVYEYVVSAATHFSKQPWVNSKKMGIQGHSFGGYQTNYLITRTDIFAAAASAAGPSDISSNLFGRFRDVAETGQLRIGAPVSQRPSLYIKNSPVYFLDRVQTPLLIMHNKKDYEVPWGQAVELFTGLRRLGKKVWMLQYDDGDHEVGGGDVQDYTTRLMQFFDYYLKEAPPPKWMTKGIPARSKGVDTGLELDLSGDKP